jgi:MAF protein
MIAHPDHSVNARLLLASASPRRRELIKLLKLPVTATAADLDETPLASETAADMAVRLSREKAQAVAADQTSIVIASDTVVSLDGEPLGKPAEAAEARTMLTRLRGRVHQVYTAVTVIDRKTDRAVTELAASDVHMREYSDDEIERYIASGDPFDKAGAYAIQHDGFSPADRFDHCFANVMGLPLCHVTRALRRLQIEPPVDVPAACQTHLNYRCPVYARILAGEE